MGWDKDREPAAYTYLSRAHAGTVFTTMLQSSLCFFNLLCTKGRSSSTSDRAPVSQPNMLWWAICQTHRAETAIGKIYVLFYLTTPQTLCIPSCKFTWEYLQSSLPVFRSDPILLTNLLLLTHSSQHLTPFTQATTAAGAGNVRQDNLQGT